jgi:hypothetical protein
MYDLPLRNAPEAHDRGDPLFALELVFNGGTGARPASDGLSATAFPSGVWGSQIETTEAVAPVLFHRRELRPDSGGAGTQRGGLGQRIEMSAATDQDVLVFLSVERVHTPAAGRHGGQPGAPGRIRIGETARTCRPRARSASPQARRWSSRPRAAAVSARPRAQRPTSPATSKRASSPTRPLMDARHDPAPPAYRRHGPLCAGPDGAATGQTPDLAGPERKPAAPVPRRPRRPARPRISPPTPTPTGPACARRSPGCTTSTRQASSCGAGVPRPDRLPRPRLCRPRPRRPRARTCLPVLPHRRADGGGPVRHRARGPIDRLRRRAARPPSAPTPGIVFLANPGNPTGTRIPPPRSAACATACATTSCWSSTRPMANSPIPSDERLFDLVAGRHGRPAHLLQGLRSGRMRASAGAFPPKTHRGGTSQGDEPQQPPRRLPGRRRRPPCPTSPTCAQPAR